MRVHNLTTAAKRLNFVGHDLRQSFRALKFIQRAEAAVARHFGRTLCIALVVALLASSFPTAVPTVVGAAKDAERSAVTWLRTSALSAKLYRGLAYGYDRYRSLNESLDSGSTRRPDETVTAAPALTPLVSPAPVVLDAPTNLTVTSVTNTSIGLSWTAPAGTVNSYQIERSQSASGPFPTIGTSITTSFNDPGVTANNAYLYRVRAVSGGIPSSPSNMALGTAISFTDNPLVSGVTAIKATHINELRQSVNAVRGIAGLSGASWTDASLPGVFIRAVHVRELREQLGEALELLDVPAPSYTDPVLATGANGTVVKKAHIEELRQKASRSSSTSSGDLDGEDLSNARLDPMNKTGGGGDDPLSRNFNWSAPLLSLPGRSGLDLGISLSYNSLVWTKSGNTISFDDDRGFPGPGFRLGFPSIQGSYWNFETGKWSYLLIGSDGGHTELRQVAINSVFYQSADSAHLLLDVTQLSNPNDPSMLLRTTDGTQLSYKPKGLAYECTEIKDRNGNFITINYNTSGAAVGRIANVHDTLDRVINFNYDANGWLTSITQEWKRQPPNQAQAITHTWASFSYVDLPIQTNFATNLTVVGPANNTTKRVLSRVTLDDNSTTAANNSHSDFDYTPFGQIWKISNFAADNHLLSYRAYKLPKSPLWMDAPAQSECPRFIERRDWVQNWNRQNETGPEQEAITKFTAPQPEDAVVPQQIPQPATMVKVTQPNLTFSKIYFVGTAGTTTGWKVGLPYLVDSYDVNGTTPERQVATTWNQDDESKSYILNPRASETNIYDRFGNRKKTVVTFAPHSLGNGTTCQLPEDIKEYADATTVLRTTRSTYISDAAYETRRMILPNEKMLYEGIVAPSNLRSKLEFKYDEASSIDGNDAPVQHDSAFGSSFLAGRGNLTSVIRYNVGNLNQFTTSTMKYNTAGAMVSSKDALQREEKTDYTDSFSNTVSQTTLAYPTKVTDPDGYYSTTKYNFDFGAVTSRKTPPANYTGNPNSQPAGPEQQLLYDDLGRLERIKSLVNNAYTRYEYPINKIRIDTFTTLVESQGEAHSFKITDGLGRAMATGSHHPATPGSTARFDAQRIVYDVMGRVFKTSNPAETSASGDDPLQWALVEGDAGSTWVYTQQTYDWKGRPRITTNPDGTTRTVDYAGCGCAGGEVATLTDEGTGIAPNIKKRQQKIYSDVLGRTWKTEVLNWDGSGPNGTAPGNTVYSTSGTTYNARDQVTQERWFAGAAPSDPNDLTCPSGTCKKTDVTYDGYGRVWKRHSPVQQIDPNNSASTDHSTFIYHDDDSLLTATDARGASSTFTYNGRGLVNHISYATPTVVAPGSPISVSPAVDFEYDAAGNRLWMNQDSLRRVSYHYDALSRMDWEERQFPGLSGTYRLSYEYNLAGALKKVTDQMSSTSMSTSFDTVGRVSGVSAVGFGGADTTFASGFQYRASGEVKSIAYGNGTTVTMNYDLRGLITDYLVGGLKTFCCPVEGPFSIGTSLQRYADGRLKFASNEYSSTIWGDVRSHDRAYDYDDKGRLKEAYSGLEAHNFMGDLNSGVAQGPYRHTFTFDNWNNTVSSSSRYWSRESSETRSFNDLNRNPDWTYDADGNLISRNESYPDGWTLPLRQSYNAAGQLASFTQQRGYFDFAANVGVNLFFNNTSTYDGDGVLVRYTKERGNGSNPPLVDETFYLRSSVLSGAVISEYDAAGVWQRGHVYAGHELIADQATDFERTQARQTWRYQNPVTGDELNANAEGVFFSKTALDPNGANVQGSDPFPPDGSGDPDGVFTPEPTIPAGISTWWPYPMDGNRVTCTVDGLVVDCGLARAYFRGGNGAFEQCPNNDCGPRVATVTARSAGAIVGTSSFLIAPGQLGWDGSLDGTYRLSPAFAGQFSIANSSWGPQFLATLAYYGDSGGELWSQTRGAGGSPQKPRFDIPAITAIVTKALAEADCAEFARVVLNNVASKSNPVFPKDGTLSDVAAAFFNQPKKHELLTNNMPSNSRGYGNPLGNISKSTGAIATKSGSNLAVAETVVSELFHLAGAKSYYSDKQLATAVSNSIYGQTAYRNVEPRDPKSPIVINPVHNPFDRRYKEDRPGYTEQNEFAYSDYFHTIQSYYCHMQPGLRSIK